jgi:hypothetical protein
MKHECNYSTSLLELQVAVDQIKYLSTYLWGKLFLLYTDYCLKEKLGMGWSTPKPSTGSRRSCGTTISLA